MAILPITEAGIRQRPVDRAWPGTVGWYRLLRAGVHRGERRVGATWRVRVRSAYDLAAYDLAAYDLAAYDLALGHWPRRSRQRA